MRKIKNLLHLVISWWWVMYYGYPAKKLVVVGITGTDGKTTTSTLVYEIIKAAGKRVGMLSTVSAKYVSPSGVEIEMETGLHTTNPEAKLLQKILRQMVDSGVTHMVLEVTSHGLDQNRVVGCNFLVGVLTNITHEHLDYHKTMENYRSTKMKLFKMVKYAVLNSDDPSYEYIESKCKGECKVVAYKKSGMKFISSKLPGDYNRYNIAAAEAVAKILGIQDDKVQRTVKDFVGVPGRREEVKVGQKYRVVVDFAHTPNALESVLGQLKKELGEGKKLIVVFGCTGERDKQKRPLMGEIAVRLADKVIITSDDTRNESQDEIYDQIVAGIGNKQVTKENDRRKAISLAVETAKSGDIVILAGKGHEKALLIGNTEFSWSDVEEAKRAILH